MKITPQIYSEMTKQASPKSNSKVNVSVAFAVGGLICVIGQIIISVFERMGFDKTNSGTWTSIILVGASSIMTGTGMYQKIAKHAGAGTLVPITGFANAVASPAMEFKTEGYVPGTGTGMFAIAGPVIAYGTAASALYGIILLITG